MNIIRKIGLSIAKRQISIAKRQMRKILKEAGIIVSNEDIDNTINVLIKNKEIISDMKKEFKSILESFKYLCEEVNKVTNVSLKK